MNYEDMLISLDKENLVVKEKPLEGYDGRIYKNRIAIRKDMTSVEKSCVLAEEIGHYYTTAGDILDESNTSNRKQEYRARLYGYNKKIGLSGLISAIKHGCQNATDMAEYLDVTEEYLNKAIDTYRSIYGAFTVSDNYFIRFMPVLQIFEFIKLEDQIWGY